MMSKRATQGWTMTKLISFLLLIIILVLVIYGVSQKQMGPLLEKVGARFNDVFIWLGWKDSEVLKGECFTEDISDFSGGSELIKSSGVDGRLTLCKGYCQLVMNETLAHGTGSYKYIDDIFYYWDAKSKKWTQLYNEKSIGVYTYDLSPFMRPEAPSLEEYEIYLALREDVASKGSKLDPHYSSIFSDDMVLPSTKPGYLEGGIWFNVTLHEGNGKRKGTSYFFDGNTWYKLTSHKKRMPQASAYYWKTLEPWSVTDSKAIEEIHSWSVNTFWTIPDHVDWGGAGFFADELNMRSFAWEGLSYSDALKSFTGMRVKLSEERKKYEFDRDTYFYSVLDNITEELFSFEGEEYRLKSSDYEKGEFIVYFKKGDKHYGVVNYYMGSQDELKYDLMLIESDDGRFVVSPDDNTFFYSSVILGKSPGYVRSSYKEVDLFKFLKVQECD